MAVLRIAALTCCLWLGFQAAAGSDTDRLDELDRQEFRAHIERARACVRSADFDCASKAVADAGKFQLGFKDREELSKVVQEMALARQRQQFNAAATKYAGESTQVNAQAEESRRESDREARAVLAENTRAANRAAQNQKRDARKLEESAAAYQEFNRQQMQAALNSGRPPPPSRPVPTEVSSDSDNEPEESRPSTSSRSQATPAREAKPATKPTRSGKSDRPLLSATAPEESRGPVATREQTSTELSPEGRKRLQEQEAMVSAARSDMSRRWNYYRNWTFPEIGPAPASSESEGCARASKSLSGQKIPDLKRIVSTQPCSCRQDHLFGSPKMSWYCTIEAKVEISSPFNPDSRREGPAAGVSK